ncbi:hypothetical protein HaLaN_30845, partial [Haematococcus lacustris]
MESEVRAAHSPAAEENGSNNTSTAIPDVAAAPEGGAALDPAALAPMPDNADKPDQAEQNQQAAVGGEVEGSVAGMSIDSASGSGQQEVVGERRQVIKAAIRSLVEAARPDLSPAQVDAPVAEMNKRMTMGSKQCCLTAVLCLSMLLQSFLGQPTEGFPAAVPLNIWDPKLLAQIKDAMELLTTARVLEHLMRGPHHSGIKLLPAE